MNEAVGRLLSFYLPRGSSISTNRFFRGDMAVEVKYVESIPNAKRKRTGNITKCAKLNTLACTTTKSSVVQMYRKKAKKGGTHLGKGRRREGLNQH